MPFAVVLALGVFVLAVMTGKALRCKSDPLKAEHVYTVTAANIDEFSSLLPRPQAGSEASGSEPESRPCPAPPAPTARTQEQPQ